MTDIRNHIIVRGRVADLQFEELLNARHGYKIKDNPIIDSFEAVSSREIFNTAFAPMYTRRMIELTKPDHQGDDRYVFSGMGAGGDIAESPCDGEHEAARELTFDPLPRELHPDVVITGNHCGGAVFGYFWDNKNQVYLPYKAPTGLIYPNGISDGLRVCGDKDEFTHLDETYQYALDLANPNNRIMLSDIRRNIEHDVDLTSVRGIPWREGVTALGNKRWDLVVRVNQGQGTENQTDRRLENEKMSENMRRGFKLQAVERAQFSPTRETTLSIVEIAMDTQDLSEAGLTESMEKGHVSKAQVAFVLDFMEQRKSANPITAFKLALHYSYQELSEASQEAIRPLLEREDVVLVYSAHNHSNGVVNLTEVASLKRQTDLYNVWIPSPADRSMACCESGADAYAEIVWEEMSWDSEDETGCPRLDMKFQYKRLTEEIIPQSDRVEAKLKEYEDAHRYQGTHDFAQSYSQQLRVLDSLDERFQNIIQRHHTFGNTLSLAMEPGKATDMIILKGTMKKFLADVDALDGFVNGVVIYFLDSEAEELLVEAETHEDEYKFGEARDLRAQAQALIEHSQKLKGYMAWLEGLNAFWGVRLEGLWERKNATKALAEWRVEQASLEKRYGAHNFNGLFRLLNTLPDNSQAQAAALIARMQTVEEEFEYHATKEFSPPMPKFDYVRQTRQRTEPFTVSVKFDANVCCERPQSIELIES